MFKIHYTQERHGCDSDGNEPAVGVNYISKPVPVEKVSQISILEKLSKERHLTKTNFMSTRSRKSNADTSLCI